MAIPKNAVLLVIDVQKGFDEYNAGMRNNPDAEKQIEKLIRIWRAEKRPLIHIQHCSTEANSVFRPERPGNDFKPEGKPNPGETVLQKNVNSAFIGTPLEKLLRDKEKTRAREGKCRNRQGHDRLSPPDRPRDRGAEPVIARRIINVTMTVLRRWPEEHEPKPGRKVDCGTPRYDERDTGHPE